jgi:hypothetical protein
MPSTYSPDLRIELIANGEQSGTWGTTTNNNLGTLIEDAISGAASVVTATQKYALLAANGTVDEARCAILVLDTTYVGAGDYEVYAPPVTKLYVVKNASTTKDLDLYCATTINGTTAAGVAYTIPQGKTAFVRSNGVEFFDATDYVAGSVTFTNAELITPSLSGETFSTANTVAAGSNSQGSGALTADYNVITTTGSNPSGVTLPTATAGRRIIIVNKGTNPINVYPATGAAIDALSTNASTQIPVDGVLEFNASSTTRWYSYSALTLTNPLITTPSLVAAKVSTSASVTAGSNSQGSGGLTADYNVITSAVNNPSGVTLPTATTGRKILVVNRGANPVNVYPASGATIDVLGLNTAISLPVGGLLEFNASSTTQWYSSFNATTAASVGGVSFTGTQPTASVNQVAVYGATGSSITTARTYQFRATSAGAAQIQLFEDTDNGTNSIIIQPSATLAADYTLTLPTTAPTVNGQVLSGTTAGVLSWITPSSGGTGDVVGPASSTDNALARFNATTGKLIQNSVVTISDTGAATGFSTLATSSTITASGLITGNGMRSTSGSYNFTATNESIFGSSGLVSISVAGSARIDVTSSEFTPDGDNNMSLGSAAKRWIQVFAVSGTINTSDANTKQDIADLDDAEKRVAVRIKGLIKKFRFKDAVAVKGDAARIHVGVLAQEVRDAFTAEGLDASRYGLFCSDTWWEREEDVYQPFNETTVRKKVVHNTPVEGATEVTRLGVRYEELLAFVIAAI